jgi:hypothetical protein
VDLPGTLARLADTGLRRRAVRPHRGSAHALREALTANGLRAPSAPRPSFRWAPARCPSRRSSAPASAVELAVLEFDDYAGDVFEGIATGYRCVTGLI